MSNLEFAKEVIRLVGGYPNIIVVFNCYTRIRVNIRDLKKVDSEGLKKLEGVMGVVVDGAQIQIIVGPGKSSKLTQVVNQTLEASLFLQQEQESKKSAAIAEFEKVEEEKKYLEAKKGFRSKLNGKFNATMKKIGSIFVPIIPAFIACGLLLAILEIIKTANGGFVDTIPGKVFDIISGSVFGILGVIVGFNACKEFGGDGVLGACLAGIIFNPALGSVEKPLIVLGPISIYSGLGGIISVLLVAISTAYFEKLIRKFMPNAIDAFLTPLVSLAIMSMVGLFVFMPIGGFISLGIQKAVQGVMTTVPFLLGLVPMFYLLMVLIGVHHVLIPISQNLIDSTRTADAPGYSIIVPIQLMAGAAEVGAAIYFLITTKNKKMKRTVLEALPIGVLGIDEPLIWGMSFNLRRLFIPIGLAGGIVGAILSVPLSLLKCGAIVPETTGIEAALMISNNTGKWIYALCFVGAIILGFVLTALIGYKEVIETTDELTGKIIETPHETSLVLKYYNAYRAKHPKATPPNGK